MFILAIITVVCLVLWAVGGFLALMFMDTSDWISGLGMLTCKASSLVGFAASALLVLGALGIRLEIG